MFSGETWRIRLWSTADTAIGVSENPSIRFGFVADQPGALQVLVHDNEGGSFRQAMDVGG